MQMQLFLIYESIVKLVLTFPFMAILGLWRLSSRRDFKYVLPEMKIGYIYFRISTDPLINSLFDLYQWMYVPF